MQDIVFSEILYHKIGHHIHYTKLPEHTEREDVAESWMRKLKFQYFRKHYWYLYHLDLYPFIELIDWVRCWLRKLFLGNGRGLAKD